MKIIERDIPPRSVWALEQAGIHPLLARLYAARGVHSASEVNDDLKALLPPQNMLGMDAAVALLARALKEQLSICIVADYDCDGATACAVALRGLKMLGFTRLDYLVPDRIVDGYGLTGAIAKRVKETGADILMTVDNGIASVEGVAVANALGMQVLVTDHHLPGDALPAAAAIINPNQVGCLFPSKALAGVGVVFYLLMALRAQLRAQGVFDEQTQPRLITLMPLVALGTVADVVALDENNRRLVAIGLKHIRAGQLPVGMQALYAVAKRSPEVATSMDFGFALGPRINAAGRLDDMRLGIACLLTDDRDRARELAEELERINRERREIEGDMRKLALELAEYLFEDQSQAPAAITVFDPEFHEGVVGIVASRLKDKWHRPSFVFAPSQAAGQEHILKGSGRSIAGFHLRDALDLLAKREPDILLRFGGHAMAAGCTIDEENLDRFEAALNAIAAELMDSSVLSRRLLSDGALPMEFCRPDVVTMLDEKVWGQGFPAPLFSATLEVVAQRLVGEGKHLSLKLKYQGQEMAGIWFGRTEPIANPSKLAFRLSTDTWQGQARVQLMVEAAEE